MERARDAFQFPNPKARSPDFDYFPDIIHACLKYPSVFWGDSHKIKFHYWASSSPVGRPSAVYYVIDWSPIKYFQEC